MNQNEGFNSEIKLRREQFSISIRRSEQDARFSQFRRMLVSSSDSNSMFKQFNDSGKPINAYLNFLTCKNQMALALESNSTQMFVGAATQAKDVLSCVENLEKVAFTEFLDSGIVDVIFDAFRSKEFKNNPEVARILTTILSSATAGPGPLIDKLFELGLIEVLDYNFGPSDPDIIGNLIWAISNIISDHPEFLVKINEFGWFSKIFKHCSLFSETARFARITAWFYSNSMRGTKYLTNDIVI